MPVYEYRCDQCGETVERLQKMSDQPLQLNCSKGCVASKVERQISSPLLKFKGSGFYTTDYGKGCD